MWPWPAGRVGPSRRARALSPGAARSRRNEVDRGGNREPYLDDSGGFWWVSQAADDPRCATLLSTVAHLRALYEHHAAQVEDVPAFVWPTLYRDALFVPHSGPYRAMTELIAGDVDVADVAERFGVEERLLRPATGFSPSRG